MERVKRMKRTCENITERRKVVKKLSGMYKLIQIYCGAIAITTIVRLIERNNLIENPLMFYGAIFAVWFLTVGIGILTIVTRIIKANEVKQINMENGKGELRYDIKRLIKDLITSIAIYIMFIVFSVLDILAFDKIFFNICTLSILINILLIKYVKIQEYRLVKIEN